MKTQVAILHHAYPAQLRSKVESKLKELERFHARVTNLRATLERQNDDHRVELIASVGRGPVLVADVMGEEFGVVLDEALDRMKGQLKRQHDRVHLHRGRSGRA